MVTLETQLTALYAVQNSDHVMLCTTYGTPPVGQYSRMISLEIVVNPPTEWVPVSATTTFELFTDAAKLGDKNTHICPPVPFDTPDEINGLRGMISPDWTTENWFKCHVNVAANKIAAKSRRGAGNAMFANAHTLRMFGIIAIDDGVGLKDVGHLDPSNRVSCYVVPQGWLKDGEVLVAYRGNNVGDNALFLYTRTENGIDEFCVVKNESSSHTATAADYFAKLILPIAQ